MTSEMRHVPSPAGKEAPLLQLGQPEMQQLREFHASHFPNQETPDVHSGAAARQEAHDTEPEQHEELGYYEDGVRRTLTEEQVRMFRHSEIQRLLLVRRQQREKEQQAIERQERQLAQAADRKRRFDDEAVQQQQDVQTLTYDDNTLAKGNHPPSGEKKFLWPKLGIQ